MCLWDSGSFSDFEVKTSKCTHKVHKVILAQSSFFTTLLKSQFVEAETSMIDLMEEDADAIGILLKFLYTGQYVIHKDNSDKFINVKVYALADKYDVPALKKAASWYFLTWSHRLILRAMAKCELFSQSTTFLRAVQHVYEVVPEHAQAELIDDALNVAAHCPHKFYSALTPAKATEMCSQGDSLQLYESSLAENKALLASMPTFVLNMFERQRELKEGTRPSSFEKQLDNPSLKRKRTDTTAT
ncbi:MAG: hypothetical protein M1828_004031 [Chrysothrix sp. TS-e1954]|nr:MAG: hypothetical protein M1828_004031 [Chrysothrix sp. TS-e1954]